MKIKNLEAQEILDSRGNPTVRVFVTLHNGVRAEASVPSGASTGTHEALELRDGGKRYGGKGVLKACRHVERLIAPKLRGRDVRHQEEVDKLMIALDGTPNKRRLGANSILGVSLACARAGALVSGLPLYQYIRKTYGLRYHDFRLPLPTMNVVNGGRHADNNLTVQEFMIIPHARRFSERVRMGAEVFHTLKELLKKNHLSTGVGDEGGFAPEIDGYVMHMNDNEEVLRLLCDAIKKAGYKAGKHIMLGMDVAASEFYHGGRYYMKRKNDKTAWSSQHMRAVLAAWAEKYPLVFIEDGLAEDDWEAWQAHTKELGRTVTLVGDDLFVTNKMRLAEGIKRGVANAILIKLNQIGTLSETIATIKLAQEHQYKVAVSHRSGETADTFIADLAVSVNADFIKTGSLSRSERVEKYNRLMEIEHELMSS